MAAGLVETRTPAMLAVQLPAHFYDVMHEYVCVGMWIHFCAHACVSAHVDAPRARCSASCGPSHCNYPTGSCPPPVRSGHPLAPGHGRHSEENRRSLHASMFILPFVWVYNHASCSILQSVVSRQDPSVRTSDAGIQNFCAGVSF